MQETETCAIPDLEKLTRVEATALFPEAVGRIPAFKTRFEYMRFYLWMPTETLVYFDERQWSIYVYHVNEGYWLETGLPEYEKLNLSMDILEFAYR